MLSKVSKRVRRRSEQDYVARAIEPRALVVDKAPDLVRWCDFTTPFPAVALGGYAKYYAHAGSVPKVVEAPEYCPVLFRDTERSSSRDIPPRSSLFSTSSPARSLGIIQEASMESMTPRRPPTLTVTTTNSLRRQHRRLLRTPSIERDFAVLARQFLSSSASVNESSESMDVQSSSYHSNHSHSSSSHSSSAHSDSTHSESSHSYSVHSELPLTPSTSVGSADHFEGNLFGPKLWECPEETPRRPGSNASFNTAKSEFSDA